MRAMSAEFLAAMRRGGQVVTSADLYLGGYRTHTGLPVVDGQVVVDRSAAVRRTATFTIVDHTGALVPSAAGDPLTPYGTKIKLWRGYAGAETMPLGVFRIREPTVHVNEDGSVVVEGRGSDRAEALSAAKLTDTWLVAAGTNVGVAIQALLLDADPTVTFTFAEVVTVTPLLVFTAADDRWVRASELAASAGCQLYAGVDDEIVMAEEPAPGAAPDFEYVEGVDATVVSVAKTWETDPGYNGVVVLGAGPGGAQVRGEAWDDDPTSPTYYLGPYGRRPSVERSEYVTSNDQATAAAQAMLPQVVCGTETISFLAVPNPAHEAGDTVRVAASRGSIDATGPLEQFTIPLRHDVLMPASTRRRTLT